MPELRKNQFAVWRPDCGAERDDAHIVEYLKAQLDDFDFERAAKDFVENKYADWDYPSEVEIEVQAWTGETRTVVVTAEPDVCLYASVQEK